MYDTCTPIKFQIHILSLSTKIQRGKHIYTKDNRWSGCSKVLAQNIDIAFKIKLCILISNFCFYTWHFVVDCEINFGAIYNWSLKQRYCMTRALQWNFIFIYSLCRLRYREENIYTLSEIDEVGVQKFTVSIIGTTYRYCI